MKLSLYAGIFSALVLGADLIYCPENGKTVSIKENISINEIVCELTSDLKADSNITLWSGNTNDRFELQYVDGIWAIIVKKLLDSKNIGHFYKLQIKTGTETDIRDVNIQVEDVDDWPPKFNSRCANTMRTAVRSPWAFDITGDYKIPILSGLHNVSLSGKAKNGAVSFNIANDKCDVRVFLMEYVHVGSMFDFTKQLEDFQPDNDITCESQSGKENGQLERPKIKLYMKPKEHRPTDPAIPAEWFEDESEGKIAVLLEIGFGQISTDYIPSWSCQIQTHMFGFATVSINLIPEGCPLGKYGGNCNKTCVCQNGAICHPFNGACKCAPGFEGPDCTVIKEPEFFKSSTFLVVLVCITAVTLLVLLTVCVFISVRDIQVQWRSRKKTGEVSAKRKTESKDCKLEMLPFMDEHAGSDSEDELGDDR